MAQTAGNITVKFGSGNSGSGGRSINNIVYKSKEDAESMRLLSPLEPENIHNDVRTKRHEGIGEWFLKTSEFQEWRRGEGGADKAVLFCSGGPGVGKTHLR